MLDMASPPPLPKPAIPLNEPDKLISSKVPVPKRRWVVAILLAPVILVLMQNFMVLALGQELQDVPEIYAIPVAIALWALPLGITLWILRGFVRPKPPKPSIERGFRVVQNRVDR